jgi:hypothetical protein
MNQQNRQELLDIVNAALDDHSEQTIAWIIVDAHNGRPDGLIVTDSNLHLFRQYRNSVSPNPTDLIREALNSKGEAA